MSSREVSEWQAYEAIEPFGERRADYRAASICHTLYLLNGGKDDLKLEDFLLSRAEPQVTGAAKEPDVLAFARMMGAKVVQREPE
jgi:hypothetical protein